MAGGWVPVAPDGTVHWEKASADPYFARLGAMHLSPQKTPSGWQYYPTWSVCESHGWRIVPCHADACAADENDGSGDK
jgi:hypothetical protein